MPTSVTYDDIFLELARRAYPGQEVVDLTTTDAGTSTTALFDQLAYGSSGATTTRFHDQFLYFRRIRGTATAGAGTTITLESGHSFDTNCLANFTIKITSGTGSGQERVITSNTNASPSVVTVPTWTTNPSTDSVYAIYPSSSALPVPTIVRTSKALSTGSFTVASGTVTVAPAFSNASVAVKILSRSDMVFGTDIHPDELKRFIATVMTSQRFHSYLPVTLVTDGDMEDSGVTNWAAIGSPTTREKTATSYPFQFGRQALHIVTSSLDEGATSNDVPVGDEEVLELAVAIKVVSGTVDVILYRSTATAAALKTVTVSDIEPVIVWFQQSPSSGTKNVTVRFESATASSEWYVGPVMLLSDHRERYSLDTSSVVRAADVRGLFTLPLGQLVETDVYLTGGLLEPVSRQVERDDRGNLINVVARAPWYPLFMEAYQRWPELTYDTETTYADRETVVMGAMYYVEMARAAEYYASNPALASQYEQLARQHNQSYHRMLRSQGIESVVFEEARSPRTMVAFR